MDPSWLSFSPSTELDTLTVRLEVGQLLVTDRSKVRFSLAGGCRRWLSGMRVGPLAVGVDVLLSPLPGPVLGTPSKAPVGFRFVEVWWWWWCWWCWWWWWWCWCWCWLGWEEGSSVSTGRKSESGPGASSTGTFSVLVACRSLGGTTSVNKAMSGVSSATMQGKCSLSKSSLLTQRTYQKQLLI